MSPFQPPFEAQKIEGNHLQGVKQQSVGENECL
jgi:hypothetical protein